MRPTSKAYMLSLRLFLVGFCFLFYSMDLQCQGYGNSIQRSDTCSRYLDSAQQTIQFSNKVQWIQRSLDCSIRNGQRLIELRSYYELGWAYESAQQWSKASKSYDKCWALFMKHKDLASQSNSYAFQSAYQVMQHQHLQGQNREALKWSKEIPESMISLLERRRKYTYYYLLARIRGALNQHEQAILLVVEQLSDQQTRHDNEGIVESKLLIGDLYFASGNPNEALIHYESASQLAISLNNSELKIQCNQKLAQYSRKQGDLNQELFYRNSNIGYNEQTSNTIGVVKEQNEIVNAYIESDQLDKAAKAVADFDEYTQNTLSATTTSSQNTLASVQIKAGILENNANTYKRLADAYDNQKQYDKAIQFYKKYVETQDSVNASRQQELAMAADLNNAILNNEQRIELLERERALNEQNISLLAQDSQLNKEKLIARNGIIGALIVFLILLAVGAYYYMRNTKLRQKADKLIALQSLTGQMNPHFIFNALNSVNEYIGTNDERSANRYLSSFSKLMRQVMDDSRKSFIPFQDELEMLQLYLQLEHARFEDRFNYQIEIAPDFDVTQYEIPPMLIQPYLENAIWHGLRYRENKGELLIRITGDAQCMCLEITDNGIGMEQSKKLKTHNQKKQRSLAMKNTETRIRLIREVYHYPIELTISTAFDDSQYPGTRVQIELPLHQNESFQ